MKRVLTGVVVVCAFAAASVLPARAYQEPRLLFHFQDPAITESSGVVASDVQDGVLFTHNDSGDYTGEFFAIGSEGQTLATLTIAGGIGFDIEDIARGRGADGGTALFLADIGDNSLVRPFVTVYEVPEPILDTTKTGVTATLIPVVHHLVYEDPRHNAETLLVNPTTGRITIVTKDAHGQSAIYVADDRVVPNGPAVLRKIATIHFDSLSDGGQIPDGRLATGGDISPDGTRLVVRTYLEGFEWTIPAGGDLAAAVATPPKVFYMPDAPGGEAIAYTRDGTGLVTTTEGAGAPVHLLAADA